MGQPPYPPYGQPRYGRPPHRPPAQPFNRSHPSFWRFKRRLDKILLIALGIVAVVFAVCGIGTYVLVGQLDRATDAGASGSASDTEERKVALVHSFVDHLARDEISAAHAQLCDLTRKNYPKDDFERYVHAHKKMAGWGDEYQLDKEGSVTMRVQYVDGSSEMHYFHLFRMEICGQPY